MDNPTLCFLGFHLLFLCVHMVHGVITSCNQTPFPEVCDHFITNNLSPTLVQSDFTFRDTSIKISMNQAILVHQLISTMDLSSFDDRTKLAWSDCLELYDDTITQLNRSICTKNQFNSQTWLSAAIANKQTCQNGFIDFNSTSHFQFFPNLLANFSKLLSNSLAINKDSISSSAMMFSKQVRGRRRLFGDEFPTWVSVADRKLLQATASKANIVVAGDGSGDYKTIAAAVDAAAKMKNGGARFIIHVKAGVYKENVNVKKAIKNLMFIGDGIDSTIVSGNKNAEDGSTTFGSATFAAAGDGFIARDITFENTAGPQKHQAVALRSDSDLSIFFQCSFKGYQDTLYVHNSRQFYRDCDIYGSQDFIFGDSAAVIQNCNIYVRKPLGYQKNSITAQGRTDPNENTGIIVHNSRVTATGELKAVQGSIPTYLGRPWQKYSRTVFMKCSLDSLINSAGWLPWSGNFALSTLYYAEYMNTGSGASTSGRVKWPGYHVLTSAADAGKFTVGNFLGGGSWISAAGVPVAVGL